MAGSRIQYVPVSETEALSGRDFEAQTEAFLNDIYTGMETVGEKADSALALAENSIAVATEASQTASEALANAGTAQRTAEQALIAAQSAQTESGGATGIAQEALSRAGEADARAVNALEAASSAADSARAAEDQAREAREMAIQAELKAEQAISHTEAGLDIFQVEEGAANADGYFELAEKIYFSAAVGHMNFPLPGPFWFQCHVTEDRTHVTQECWDEENAYRRTAVISRPPVAGTDTLTFIAAVNGGGTLNAAMAVSAAVGQNLAVVVTGGSAVTSESSPLFLAGILRLELGAGASDGALECGGETILRFEGGEAFINTGVVETPSGAFSLLEASLSASGSLTLEFTYDWTNFGTPTVTFKPWYGFGRGAGGGDGVMPGTVTPFSGTFGGQGNKHPVNRLTGQVDTSYALCDGVTYTASDGARVTTPDLRARFVMCAGNLDVWYPPGSAGGTFDGLTVAGGGFSVGTTGAGAHAHTQGPTGGRTITIDTMAHHGHQFVTTNDAEKGGTGNRYNPSSQSAQGQTTGTGGNLPHDHDNPATDWVAEHAHNIYVADHSHTFPMLPRFYSLAYIMKL